MTFRNPNGCAGRELLQLHPIAARGRREVLRVPEDQATGDVDQSDRQVRPARRRGRRWRRERRQWWRRWEEGAQAPSHARQPSSTRRINPSATGPRRGWRNCPSQLYHNHDILRRLWKFICSGGWNRFSFNVLRWTSMWIPQQIVDV